MSESHRGERHVNYGKHLKEETKQKIGASQSGEKHYSWHKPISDEHREKISVGLRRSYADGKKVSFFKGRIPWNKGLKIKKPTTFSDSLCACGCGERTPIAKKNCIRTGKKIIKGEPLEYYPGHYLRKEYREYHRKYREKQGEKLKAFNTEWRLKTFYGLTLQKYKEMLESQGGGCAICGKISQSTKIGKMKRMAVDHNHKTGQIRQILCPRCNVLVGVIEGNDYSKTMEYLNRHNGTIKMMEKDNDGNGGIYWHNSAGVVEGPCFNG